MSFSAPPALPNIYDGQCNRDPASPLPNARRVSIEFHPNITNEDNTVSEEFTWGMTGKICISSHYFQPNLQATLMVMQFGQFLDHDLTLTLEIPESEANDCCAEDAGRFAPGCFPILFADSDPTFANLG